METATSMFMLIVSAVLIFGVLNFLHGGEGRNEDLIDLRIYQIECLGEVIISGYQTTYSTRETEPSKEGSVHFWDGLDIHCLGSDEMDDPHRIQSSISLTPDGLSSLLVVYYKDRPDIQPVGEFVQWSRDLQDRVFFVLYLSIHPGTLQIGGF